MENIKNKSAISKLFREKIDVFLLESADLAPNGLTAVAGLFERLGRLHFSYFFVSWAVHFFGFQGLGNTNDCMDCLLLKKSAHSGFGGPRAPSTASVISILLTVMIICLTPRIFKLIIQALVYSKRFFKSRKYKEYIKIFSQFINYTSLSGTELVIIGLSGKLFGNWLKFF